jgi:hypothetical protein
MAEIIVKIEAQALVPTLQVYKQYFDAKYPCTDETNDGSKMPIEDEMKFATYSYLLETYNKCKEMFDDTYKVSLKKLSDAEFDDVPDTNVGNTPRG